ncbi:PREDICTED: E3 ubiquitin-protein ligase TRIM69 [Dipodomys ordii]|uniref:E3 ubiquitin-protein ligase TRIM69 n=1 Tax=Dipodomys ordii TaxID=10020 RepID=A0A1S3EN95_DIPOR|nr:PREDICTED: E3 ubiquitin-protein ligase TRIM69 [Dipodomys ordii]
MTSSHINGNYIEGSDTGFHIPSKTMIQDITMELHCSLCKEWYRDPLMLSCGHNFCQACIKEFWKLQTRETFCPQCKMLCQHSNCTYNLVLEKLVEKIKKLQLIKGQPQCPEHGETLKLFNKQERKLMCFQCKDIRISMGESKEFLQISDAFRIMSVCLSPLTLDPKTAHPNLLLSKNYTSVWHSDIKQALTDNPERFDSSVAVLASQGFTSGKWYWEAEVANKTKWTVGVAKESIVRKGSCPLTPEQGFWLLRLRNRTDLKALDLPACILKLTKKLDKVGIYLDYEEGQVSFYNAKNMAHIYTFSSIFVEKLYPYFCPCLNDGGENKEPLYIVHPQ